MVLRDRLRGSAAARNLYERVIVARARAVNRLLGGVTIERLPRELKIRFAYRILLGREPDPDGLTRGLINFPKDAPRLTGGSGVFGAPMGSPERASLVSSLTSLIRPSTWSTPADRSSMFTRKRRR